MSPTARTLQECRRLGLTAQVVEHRVPGSKFLFTRDLFGCIDVLALESGVPGCLGIQTTTRQNAAARLKKILAEPRAKLFLECGNRLEIWTWSKMGPRGKRKLWTLHRDALNVAMFTEVACSSPSPTA